MRPRSNVGRWAAFYTVGALGMGVQLVTVWLLSGWGGIPYLAATALAVEVAIPHNFLWHERWTWVDRTAPASRFGLTGPVLGRLARFHLANGLVSIWGNVAGTGLLVTFAGTGYLVGNLLSIAACSIVTFAAADGLVFASPSAHQAFTAFVMRSLRRSKASHAAAPTSYAKHQAGHQTGTPAFSTTVDGGPARKLDVDLGAAVSGQLGKIRLSPDGRQWAYVAGKSCQTETWVLENFLPTGR